MRVTALAAENEIGIAQPSHVSARGATLLYVPRMTKKRMNLALIAGLQSGSMSLSGNVATVGDQGSATLIVGGTSVPCTFTQSGTFTKS
jgi:hypothetical protein